MKSQILTCEKYNKVAPYFLLCIVLLISDGSITKGQYRQFLFLCRFMHNQSGQFFRENDVMKKSIVVLLVFLSACASISGSKEKPRIYEEQMAGNHALLAHCVVKRLRSDSRWSLRLLQFSNRLYPDIDTSEIYAHDVRFLPGIYARNSPTNPDAVFDYAGPNPEIRSHDQRSPNTEPPYAFALMIRQIDNASVMATLRGSRYAGDIAWEHLQKCVVSKKEGTG